MKQILMRWKNNFILSVAAILVVVIVVLGHNQIPYSIDWTNPNLITQDNTWSVSEALGVRGYSGADLTVAPGTDARTILTESTVLDVDANETNPNTLVEGGVAEFEIANPTIALKGSDTAPAPYINLLVDSRGLSNIRVRFNVRDIDSTANNAVQQVAVQYRLDEKPGTPYMDLPGAYIADATQGGTATLVTPVDVTLPPDANNITFLEIRVMTVNAVGADEWIGIDDIQVTGSTTVVSGECTPTTTVTEGDLAPGGLASFGVTSGNGTVTVDHVNAGTGLRSFTVVNSSNVVINIPSFTQGTLNPTTATFTVIDESLPVDFTLRAASQFHSILIRARCACTPAFIDSEDPMFPGGLESFEAFSPEPGVFWVDHINVGNGLRVFEVVNATNAVVNIDPFTPGTYNRVFANYSIINPSLPVNITVRARSQFHGILINLQCGTPPPRRKTGSYRQDK